MEQLLPWELLLKKIVWRQLGELQNKKILDFGSGFGVTADHYAQHNQVIAIEPSEESVMKRSKQHSYQHIIGSLDALKTLEDDAFDIVFCHNVLEYVAEREAVIRELYRVLKPCGMLSVIKHNRMGRVMLETVLHNQFENAYALLDGKEIITSKYGTIHYYEDDDIAKWSDNGLTVAKVYGIRTFWDLQQNQSIENDRDWQEQMMQLEMRVSQMEVFRAVAFFHHLILIK